MRWFAGLALAAAIAAQQPHTRPRSSEHTREKPRSAAQRKAFIATHPCPATGRTSGSCPGYVVDHIRPLACGGPDVPSNMQWQTIAAAKEKDKIERVDCR